MPETIPLAPLLAALGIMLGASLIVERVLAVFAWLLDRLFLLRKTVKSTPEAAFEENIALLQQAEAESKALEEEKPEDPALPEEIPARGRTRPQVQPFEIADEKAVAKEFWLQILGFLVGAVACYYTRFSMWQLFDWLPGIQKGAPQLWEFFLTGIVIGAGSKPIHFLMKFLLERKIEQPVVGTPSLPSTPTEEEKPSASAEAPQGPPMNSPVPQPLWKNVFGFTYDGGYKPERLEYTHLRTHPINLIVIHHTAMHSDSPFAAIVEEFRRKNWLAGYHSIVFKDGTVRTFTRWDRVGSHVKGYNYRSLGIAFHGNFEPDPAVPFSNPDGRLGILVPTPEQLEMGARVIALWVLLYKIPLDFTKHIVPHRQLASKACPGSNFPVEALQEQVRHFVNQWQTDESAQMALKQFQSLPYLA